MKTIIIIPAYNEEKTILLALKSLKNKGYRNIIVIDDGSIDNTYKIAKKEAKWTYRHIINRGLGGALTTGIKAALKEGADIMVTFDADLQHDPNDIKKVITPLIKKEADVVIGNRLSKGMPFTRRIGNIGLDIITWFLFGKHVNDTQSGLRAFTKTAAKKLDLRTNRMEISSEIIKEIARNKLRLKEVSITPIYTKYSLQKGQSPSNAINIIIKLIYRRFMK